MKDLQSVSRVRRAFECNAKLYDSFCAVCDKHGVRSSRVIESMFYLFVLDSDFQSDCFKNILMASEYGNEESSC